MKKHLLFYIGIILFVSLASCKEKHQAEKQKNSISELGSELPDSIPTVARVDTIFAINAPSRITRKIRNDKEGNLLIAAFEDVIRYDGESFSKIPKVEGFESIDAFDALEDSKGNIWIASTHYGVFRYDGKDFIHFTTDNGLADNRTIDIYEDKAGNIWIATLGGASCYNGKSFRNFTTKDGLTHNEVNTIMEDKTGKIWIGTIGNACVYDGKTFTKITNEHGKVFENVRYIIEDKKGNIWLGGKDGLWQYDGKIFTNFSQKLVGYIYEDKKGNIWTSSESIHSYGWALSRYDESTLTHEKATAIEIIAEQRMLFGISEDNEGNIWVGTLQGVFNYNGKSINYFKNEK